MNGYPDNWKEIAWNAMPVEQRQAAVDRLKEILDPLFFTELQDRMTAHGEDWQPVDWHFSQGMFIRNLLRSNSGLDVTPHSKPIKDDELPSVPYYHLMPATWDDFYGQVLEACVGFRSVA